MSRAMECIKFCRARRIRHLSDIVRRELICWEWCSVVWLDICQCLRDEKKGKTQEKMESGSRKRSSSAGSEKMERVGCR